MPTELINAAKLHQIITNWSKLPWIREVDQTQLDKCQSLYEQVTNNQHTFNYLESTKPWEGRQFVKGVSLQSLMREIRNSICEDYYCDYDIVNCHPTILTDLLIQFKQETSLLEDYCSHRDDWLDEVMTIHHITREVAKKQISILINGGQCYYLTQRFIKMNDYLTKMRQFLWDRPEYHAIREWVEERYPNENTMGSFIAEVLGIYERSIIDAALDLIQKDYPVTNVVKMFDGFLLPKEFNIDLQKLNDYVFDKTFLEIQFIKKPMTDIFDLSQPLPDKISPKIKITIKPKPTEPTGHIDFSYVRTFVITETDDNGRCKEVIDRTRTITYLNNFLIFAKNTKPFVIEINDLHKKGFIFHSKTKGLKDDVFAPIAPFFVIWLSSTDRREVTEITYIPYLREPVVEEKNTFNLFRGFKFTKKGYDNQFKIDMTQVNPWIDLIKHNWCNDDPKLFNYVINWFAHKVQHPNKKLISTIVITSVLEGIGKNTFFDFFNKHVLGEEFGLTVGSIDDLLCRFNEKYETSLILCCDELKNRGSKFEHTDELKKLVTQTTRNVEAKFMSTRTNCPDYNDYIFFTNNWGVIKPSMSDRRYFCIEGNCDRANLHDYWANIYQFMNDVSGKNFFYYLAGLDITEFNPRDIPMTSWKRELVDLSISPEMKAMIQYITFNKNEFNFVPIGDLITTYESIVGNKFKLNHRSFSKKVHKLLGTESSHNGKCRGIKISREFMMSKIRSIMKDNDYDFVDDDDDDKLEGCNL